jgi:hypothetical protein
MNRASERQMTWESGSRLKVVRHRRGAEEPYSGMIMNCSHRPLTPGSAYVTSERSFPLE